jgi:hypothetical protein
MVITGMSEPADDILQRNRSESGSNSIVQSFSGTRLLNRELKGC